MPLLLVDAHIPYLSDMLPDAFTIETFQQAYPRPELLERADALIIRTLTRIDETLLNVGRNIQFVGTATAGFDHVDVGLLKQRGIQFGYAPGCNARAVAEYVLTAILLWAEDRQENLTHLRLGLVGFGFAGSQVEELARKLSLTVLCYDPPKAQRESDFQSVSQEEILACDILSFHCSLDAYPEYPSWHWLNAERLALCSAKLIINAARGGVIDENALLAHKVTNAVDIVTDVWEKEPEFKIRLLQHSFIATPHIAGYSVQAKWKGSRMIADQVSASFGMESLYQPIPAVAYKTELNAKNLNSALTQLHPIMEYDHRLRQLSGGTSKERNDGFLKLRAGFPLRHEYPYIRTSTEFLDTFPILRTFSFRDEE